MKTRFKNQNQHFKEEGTKRVVKEDYEKGYAKGRDYTRHERERGMVDTVFDALFATHKIADKGRRRERRLVTWI